MLLNSRVIDGVPLRPQHEPIPAKVKLATGQAPGGESTTCSVFLVQFSFTIPDCRQAPATLTPPYCRIRIHPAGALAAGTPIGRVGIRQIIHQVHPPIVSDSWPEVAAPRLQLWSPAQNYRPPRLGSNDVLMDRPQPQLPVFAEVLRIGLAANPTSRYPPTGRRLTSSDGPGPGLSQWSSRLHPKSTAIGQSSAPSARATGPRFLTALSNSMPAATIVPRRSSFGRPGRRKPGRE